MFSQIFTRGICRAVIVPTYNCLKTVAMTSSIKFSNFAAYCNNLNTVRLRLHANSGVSSVHHSIRFLTDARMMENLHDICPRALRLQNGIFTRLYSGKIEPPTLTADFNYVKNATTNNSVLIVDVREPDEVKEHGKIPNSVNIPLGSVPAVLGEMSEKQFEKTFNRQKPSENTEIIFYCMIGKRSARAQQDAINAGYKNTKNYLGSWNDWASNQQTA